MTLATAFFGVLQFIGNGLSLGEFIAIVLLAFVLRGIRAIG